MADRRTRTALIVGGTGQIGTATARRLAQEGWSVLLAHRGNPGGDPSLADLDVTTVRLDRENTPRLLEIARGHDLVLDTVAFDERHADQLAQLAGEVESLVVISTGSVYVGRDGSYLDVADDQDPSTFPDYPLPLRESDATVDNAEDTYSPRKAAMERRLLGAEGLPVSILRPGAVHGRFGSAPREWFFVKRALDGRTRVVLSDDGRSRFSTSSTENIAELVIRCAERPGRRVLNIAERDTPAVAEIAQAVYTELDRPLEVVTFPGPPQGTLGSTPWSTPLPLVLSTDAAEAEVGYRQREDYAAAMRAEIPWLLREVSDAERDGRTWQDAFPALVARYGAGTWFDYAAEDAWMTRRR